MEIILEKMTTEKKNFLKKIEPYRDGSTLYASEYHLMKITKLSRQALLSMMNSCGFEIDDSQKWRRRKVSKKTLEKIQHVCRRVEENPDVSLETLGNELGCSRQYVKELIDRYGIQRPTRK